MLPLPDHLVNQLELREVHEAGAGGGGLQATGHVGAVIRIGGRGWACSCLRSEEVTCNDEAVKYLGHLFSLLPCLLPASPLLVYHAQSSWTQYMVNIRGHLTALTHETGCPGPS